MAESGRKQDIKIYINVAQDGDTRVENRTETHFVDSHIEQVNIQQDPNDDAAEDPNHDAAEAPCNDAAEDSINVEADEIIEGVGEMNLSSSVPTSVRRKSKVSSNQGKSVKACASTKNNETRSAKQNSLRCEFLRVQAASLCEKSKFREAESVLEEISQIQQEDVGVSALLLIAEVSIQLGRKQEAKKAIDIVRLSMTSPYEVDDVFRRASDLVVDKSYVRAIVILRISSGLYKLHPSLSPDNIVEGIRKCVDNMRNAVGPMIKSGDRLKIIALDCALPYMVEMVDELRSVKNSDPIRATIHEASCVNSILFNYNLAKEYKKTIEFRNSGLDVMERQFGNNASKYEIYGHLLHNLGFANQNLGRLNIAEDCYKKAIDAYSNATDYSNKDEKKNRIKKSQNNLRITRKYMK